MFEFAKMTYKTLRRLLILLIGGTMVLIGLVMFFTPGPGVLVILVGLALLATEFIWARILLRKFKEKAQSVSTNMTNSVKRAFNNNKSGQK